MVISSIRVRDYKSFLDSGVLELKPGFNVVIGRNNAGKTALLEALALRFEPKVHRSLITHPTRTTPLTGYSVVDLGLFASGDELRGLIQERARDFFLPMSAGMSKEAALDFAVQLLRTVSVTVHASFRSNDVIGAVIDQWPGVPTERSAYHFTYGLPAGVSCSGLQGAVDPSGQLPAVVANIFRERLYLFKAERLNVGSSLFGVLTELRSDASNLPEVLNNLQRNPMRFARFNELVKSVFPDLHFVSVRSAQANQLEILVWTIDPATERDDLAIPLAESGTGVGQVLAMLYVALTAEYPRTIVIDEPQSFLHPDAVRRLFSVLHQAPLDKHQYVVATHSPGAVAVADAASLLLVRRSGSESDVSIVDRNTADGARLVLAEVGARLSDVFGADAILWVEGATEEICYPLILKTLTGRALKGVQVLGLVQVGDLTARQGRTALEIYRRLSGGPGLIPPAIGFILDREARSEREMDDLRRGSRNLISFIGRRTYENYLLDAEAISVVLGDSRREHGIAPTSAAIAEWLEQAQRDGRFMGGLPAPTEAGGRDWVRDADGARLLEALFQDLSGGKVEYRKVEHSVQITRWLLERRPDALREVASTIELALTASG